MSRPRIVIVHSWGGNPDTFAFYASSRRELEAEGFPVDVPAMPTTHQPRLNPWVDALRSVLAPRYEAEKRIVVTHSLGGVTTMRCIERGLTIDGLIMVAANTSHVGFPDEIGEFFEGGIDYAAVRNGVSSRPELFYSDDDPYVPVEEGLALSRAVGGDITIMEGMGHFSGPVSEPGSCTKLPEVVQAARRVAQIVCS